MSKVILFDLYDTVLKEVSFNFNAGSNYLYDCYFSTDCSLKEFMNYSKTFIPLYDKRKIDNSEVNLVKDEILLYFDKFAVQIPKDLIQFEFDIMNQMQQVTILEEVKYTLEELQRRKIPMYILSNSIFSIDATKKLLDNFQIGNYFNEVFVSADFGVRKPDHVFFERALEKIMMDNPQLRKHDIYYIGNDYSSDVIGAKYVDLNIVWYNISHLENINNIKLIDIDNFAEILNIV